MDRFKKQDEWNPPLSLEGEACQPWPHDVFPEPFMTFVSELSRSTETPIELSALLSLAVVATATQGRYEVQIKSDYSEPINLWILGILPPASRKSRVYAEVTMPLREWEQEQKELVEPAITSAISQRKTLEARLKELRSYAAKAKDNEYEILQQEIEHLEGNQADIPPYPQMWTSDVTPEHLGTIMSLNNESMAVLSDEGGIFDILGGLYSDGKANIDLFLQAHAASPVRVDRGSKPPIFLQRPVLTIGLAVQPQVVKSICSNRTFRGRGLLGRFLYMIPPSNIGSRSLEEPSMKIEDRKDFQNAIYLLLERSKTKQKDLLTLLLTSEAFDKWKEFSKKIESLMKEGTGNLSQITDWAGKLPGAVARIAALLHIMRYVREEPCEHSISLEDMSAAVKIGYYLTNQALTVFNLLDEDNATAIAKHVLHWIKSEKKMQFTQRECMRKFRRYKKVELRPAFEVLKDHEFLREHEMWSETGVGRSSGVFEVNPLLHNS